MILFPGAKINLFLRITKKRHDGFHNIETLFYPVPFHDILEIIISGTGDFSFSSSGIPTDNDPENNLVVRAYHLFSRYHAIRGVSVHLHKQIPVGGGLGGGSSDAASCLIGLNSLTDKTFTHTKLREMAIQLGSDCPFFIKNKPLLAKGRGDIFQDINLQFEGKFLVLANAGVAISTAEAYSNTLPDDTRAPFSPGSFPTTSSWRSLLTNDFEEYAFHKYPLLKEIKQAMYDTGAFFALMSGSGSSVFGLFEKRPLLPAWLKKYTIYNGVL